LRRLRTALLSIGAIFALAIGTMLTSAGPSEAAATQQTASAGGHALPCDIYRADKTPCVAAHSMVRALYKSYDGPLYEVQRSSDNRTADIGVLTKGGYADAAAQDAFCAGTHCIVTKIYDQSPQNNYLSIETAGGNGPADHGAVADALPVSIGGHRVYGLDVTGQVGYRDNVTTGVARNGQPESMYMVASGTHYNNLCCFDYGNAETNNLDTGNGHMDALNLGSWCQNAPCYGQGPWVQADMENGLYMSNQGGSLDPNYTGSKQPYVTATLKNNGQNFFALKYGDAQSGSLTTLYSGPEPSRPGYSPMQQEGAIVLGTGGDNSNGSIGSFFEGVMTAGVASDAAEDAVQANIVSAGYGGPNGVAPGSLTPGSAVSLRATTPCCTTRYVRAQGQNAPLITSVIDASSSAADKKDATWIVTHGLANSACLSFESPQYPGDYLRQKNGIVSLQPEDGTNQFAQDATFCATPGISGQGTSFRSFDFPAQYIRHFANVVYSSAYGGPNPWDGAAQFWNDDVSWDVTVPWT
jgi:hypothetical protein